MTSQPGTPDGDPAGGVSPAGDWEVVDPGGPGRPPAGPAAPDQGWTGWTAMGGRVTVVRIRPGCVLGVLLLWGCLGLGLVIVLLQLGLGGGS